MAHFASSQMFVGKLVATKSFYCRQALYSKINKKSLFDCVCCLLSSSYAYGRLTLLLDSTHERKTLNAVYLSWNTATLTDWLSSDQKHFPPSFGASFLTEKPKSMSVNTRESFHFFEQPLFQCTYVSYFTVGSRKASGGDVVVKAKRESIL